MDSHLLAGAIEARTATVAVIGLGYVGLPVAIGAARAGFGVVGYDTEAPRIASLARGESHVLDIDAADLASELAAGRFRPTNDAARLADADIVVICVPTPLRNELPDMSYIEHAGRAIAATLRPGRLVILESTTYPGTTEEYLRDILEASGLRAGEDFWLGFSPERIDPGNPQYQLANVPKIVGGLDEATTDLMEAFYGCFTGKVVRVSSPKAAEMAKLLENTYRHVNIALVNEIALLCHEMGVNVWEVIDAAASKPFGFQAFYPGPGWGGHCIPVDPAYLSWRVRQMHQTAHFIDLAREMNERMPVYVAQRVGDALNEEGKSLKGSTLLVLGVAYKADVADLRESPALNIIARLRRSGADVVYHDPYLSSISLEEREHDRAGEGAERAAEVTMHSVALSEELLQRADLTLIITNHSSYDWDWITRHARLILDTRNALAGFQGRIIRL